MDIYATFRKYRSNTIEYEMVGSAFLSIVNDRMVLLSTIDYII